MLQHEEGTQSAFSFSSKAWRAGPWASPQSSAYSPCRVRPQGWGQFLGARGPPERSLLHSFLLEQVCWRPVRQADRGLPLPLAKLLPCGWYPAVPGQWPPGPSAHIS